MMNLIEIVSKLINSAFMFKPSDIKIPIKGRALGITVGRLIKSNYNRIKFRNNLPLRYKIKLQISMA